MKTKTFYLLLLITLLCRPAFCGEIHDAARNGDLEKVKSLLDDNPNLVSDDGKDGNHMTPLHWAALCGHKDVVELLLDKGANYQAKDFRGNTPLHFAALYNREDVVKLLVEKGADMNAMNEKGQTPLLMAKLIRHYLDQDNVTINTTANEYYCDYETNCYVCYHINHIGNLGDLKTVLDLRGFIPFNVRKPDTKEEFLNDIKLMPNCGMSVDYYEDHSVVMKVPTKIGVGLIYYGQGDFDEVPHYIHNLLPYQISKTPMDKMDNVNIIPEKDLDGEFKQWANVAYDISGGGETLYRALGGGSGYKSSEPVAVLFTDDSVLILIFFRYESILWTGNYLVCLEFSRNLKRYKSVYDIYDTFTFSPSQRAALEKSGPIIMKSLLLLSGASN